MIYVYTSNVKYLIAVTATEHELQIMFTIIIRFATQHVDSVYIDYIYILRFKIIILFCYIVAYI